jgi:hypothetical protein
MAMLQNSLREASYQLLKKGSQNINSLKETEWCIMYLNNSAAILMGTKNNYLRKNRFYNKWNAIFRNTLNAFLDYMVTILISNAFQNIILELMNNIDLSVHINYLQNLLISNSKAFLVPSKWG